MTKDQWLQNLSERDKAIIKMYVLLFCGLPSDNVSINVDDI